MAPHSSTLAWNIPGWRSLMGSRAIGAEKLPITRVVHGVATSQS